jgi:hypothetical protein
MRILIKEECKQGRFPWRRDSIETVDSYVDAFRRCYEILSETFEENRINAWTFGYSATEGYFGNQYLVTFEILDSEVPPGYQKSSCLGSKVKSEFLIRKD